jgi:hypothetical protein
MLKGALGVADALIVFLERSMRFGVFRIVQECALEPTQGLSLLTVPHQDEARFTAKIRTPRLLGDLRDHECQALEV